MGRVRVAEFSILDCFARVQLVPGKLVLQVFQAHAERIVALRWFGRGSANRRLACRRVRKKTTLALVIQLRGPVVMLTEPVLKDPNPNVPGNTRATDPHAAATVHAA